MTNDEQCCKRVWNSAMGGYQCSKRGRFEEDGNRYCGTHLPSKVQARRAERTAQWQAKWDEDRNRAQLARLSSEACKGLDVADLEAIIASGGVRALWEASR